MTEDPRTMTLQELVEGYGRECSYGGSGASSDYSDEYRDEIKRRIGGIGRHLGDYRGAKTLREGIRAAVDGAGDIEPDKEGSL